VRVAVGPELARPAAAATVAAIVEQQDVEAGVAQQRGMHHAIADVARVAVTQQHMCARRSGACRQPPAVQPLAIAGLNRHVLERKPGLRRRRQDLARGQEQQRIQKGRAHG
jgi:hypothetical protein